MYKEVLKSNSNFGTKGARFTMLLTRENFVALSTWSPEPDMERF